MYKLGETVSVKCGPGNELTCKVYTGEIVAIEFNSVKLDCFDYVTSNKEVSATLNKYGADLSSVRYGLYIKGLLKYFWKHDIINQC